MRDKRKAHEEKMEECSAPMIREDKFRAGAKLHQLKTARDEAWDEVRTTFRIASAKLRFRATGHVANGHARRLAEAIILQSIEDLWNPVCKKGSLMFFQGDGFALCSEIAGIS